MCRAAAHAPRPRACHGEHRAVRVDGPSLPGALPEASLATAAFAGGGGVWCEGRHRVHDRDRVQLTQLAVRGGRHRSADLAADAALARRLRLQRRAQAGAAKLSDEAVDRLEGAGARPRSVSLGRSTMSD